MPAKKKKTVKEEYDDDEDSDDEPLSSRMKKKKKTPSKKRKAEDDGPAKVNCLKSCALTKVPKADFSQFSQLCVPAYLILALYFICVFWKAALISLVMHDVCFVLIWQKKAKKTAAVKTETPAKASPTKGSPTKKAGGQTEGGEKWKWWETRLLLAYIPGLILGLHPANERRRYKVTPSLIGWVQT